MVANGPSETTPSTIPLYYMHRLFGTPVVIDTIYTPEPLETRLEHIERIKKLKGARCAYVPTGSMAPRFGDMSDEQMRFYAYYRTLLDHDIAAKSDDCYNHLLLLECLSTEEGREKLLSYLSEPRQSTFYRYAKDYATDIEVSKGNVPLTLRNRWTQGRHMLLTDIFLPKFNGLGWGSFKALADSFGICIPDYGMCDIVSIANTAFELVDDRMRKDTGKGIGETFAGAEVSCSFRPLIDTLPEEECPYSVIVYRTFLVKKMRPLISDIIAVCGHNNSFCKRKEHRNVHLGNATNYLIPKDIVSKILHAKCGSMDPKDYPDIHDGPVRVEVSRDGGLSQDYPPPEIETIYDDRWNWFSTDLGYGRPLTDAILDDLDYIIRTKSEIPQAYSDIVLTDGGIRGKEYYKFWRDRYLEGKRYSFNVECIYVRYLESVRSGHGHKEMLKFIDSLIFAGCTISPALEHVVLETSWRHDCPIPEGLTTSSYDISCYSIRRVADGKNQSLARLVFLLRLRLVDCGYDRTNDGLWKAFTYTFAAVMRRVKRASSDEETYGLSFCNKKRPCIFGSCTTECHHIEYPTIGDITKTFIEETQTLSRHVRRWYLERIENNRARKKELIVFGVDIVPIMNKAIDLALAPPKKTADEISMDSELIRQAEEDLDYVVNAMASDDPEPEPEAPVEKTEKTYSEGDPWASLINSLNDAERKYLEACMKGTRTDVRIEGSINSKASETVGDVIIEDGKVFEEYVKRISETLKKNP